MGRLRLRWHEIKKANIGRSREKKYKLEFIDSAVETLACGRETAAFPFLCTSHLTIVPAAK